MPFKHWAQMEREDNTLIAQGECPRCHQVAKLCCGEFTVLHLPSCEWLVYETVAGKKRNKCLAEIKMPKYYHGTYAPF